MLYNLWVQPLDLYNYHIKYTCRKKKPHLKNWTLNPDLQNSHLLSFNKQSPTRNSISKTHLQTRSLAICHSASQLFHPPMCPCMASKTWAPPGQADTLKFHCCQRKPYSITTHGLPCSCKSNHYPSLPFSFQVMHKSMCSAVCLYT